VRRGSVVKAQMVDRKGYQWVKLWIVGKSHTRYVARLVAAAYVGPRPVGYVVRHKDGVKQHNHFSNLEYGTRSENELDKRRHGTAPIGENHPAAKLTAAKVAAIRARYQGNSRSHSYTAIAKDYGVTPSLIRYIVIGKLWKP